MAVSMHPLCHYLFVSPWEASVGEGAWELQEFTSKEELDAYVNRRDLTKDYYMVTGAGLLELMRKACDDAEE